MKSSKALFAALATIAAFAAQAESPDLRGQFATQTTSQQTRAEVRVQTIGIVGDRHLDTDGSTVHAVAASANADRSSAVADRAEVRAQAIAAARAGKTGHGEIYGG